MTAEIPTDRENLPEMFAELQLAYQNDETATGNLMPFLEELSKRLVALESDVDDLLSEADDLEDLLHDGVQVIVQMGSFINLLLHRNSFLDEQGLTAECPADVAEVYNGLQAVITTHVQKVAAAVEAEEGEDEEEVDEEEEVAA